MDPSHPVPAQRATDSDREAAADALRTAGADGRLTVEEMEHRLAAVFAAKTHPDLDAQLADLQGRQALASSNAARQPTRKGDPSAPEVARTLTIMGENRRGGFWRPAADSRVITVMGEATIDLGEADLSQPVSHMRVITVLGSTRIDVPAHLNVHVTKVTLLGENDVELSGGPAPAGTPELHIHLISILGEAKVRFSRGRGRQDELNA
jgi:hypothetical protein